MRPQKTRRNTSVFQLAKVGQTGVSTVLVVFFCAAVLILLQFSLYAPSPSSVSEKSRVVNGGSSDAGSGVGDSDAVARHHESNLRMVKGSEPPPLSPLLVALHAAAAHLDVFLPGERVPLLLHTVALTGHPPLVSRSDSTASGDPDYANFGIPAEWVTPSFFAVDHWEAAGPGAGAAGVRLLSDSPLRYAARSEDAVRDILFAVLASSGHTRGGGAAGGAPALSCRASPVTSSFACLASLRQARPHLFAGIGGDSVSNRDSAPLPAALGGPLVVDIGGYSAAGYFAALAGALGVDALAVDAQPQCAAWGRAAARATGGGGSGAERAGAAVRRGVVDVLSAVLIPPAAVGHSTAGAGSGALATVRAPAHSGCIGTSTVEPHASRQAVAEWYYGVPSAATASDDTGRAAAEASRGRVGTEGAAGAGRRLHAAATAASGGSIAASSIEVPLASADDLLWCALYPQQAAAPAEGAGKRSKPLCPGATQRQRLNSPVADTPPPPPTLLLVKIDARGREDAVLSGLARTFDSSPGVAPLHLVIELNKQHAAAAMGLPSAVKASAEAAAAAAVVTAAAARPVLPPAPVPGAPGPVAGEALSSGYALPRFVLSPEDNAAVAARIVATLQGLLMRGYEVLVADRGWWAAQDPFTRVHGEDPSLPLPDGTTLSSWAIKLSQDGEVDVWAYRPLAEGKTP